MPKTDICIIGFWETFECIFTRKSECDDMFYRTRECIHDRRCHRDGFWWFGSIHHGHRHLDWILGGIASEDISSELAESIIQCCPHISLNPYLCNNISTIRSYSISVPFFNESGTWLLYPPYHKEGSENPDDEGNTAMIMRNMFIHSSYLYMEQ